MESTILTMAEILLTLHNNILLINLNKLPFKMEGSYVLLIKFQIFLASQMYSLLICGQW